MFFCESYKHRGNKIFGSAARRTNIAFGLYIEGRKRNVHSVDVTYVNGECLILGV